jgi:hypothetical protein
MSDFARWTVSFIGIPAKAGIFLLSKEDSRFRGNGGGGESSLLEHAMWQINKSFLRAFFQKSAASLPEVFA